MIRLSHSFSFSDYYGNQVQLALSSLPFSRDPRHIWVICRFHRQWLLTRHRRRGLEFPGGKVEPGETPEDAANREVFEETGARVSRLRVLGQYQVKSREECIVKNVYFAEIDRISLQKDYLETDGPFFVSRLPAHIKTDKRYSFLMKDQVLTESLQMIRESNWADFTDV